MKGCLGEVKKGFRRMVTVNRKDKCSIPGRNREQLLTEGKAFVKARKWSVVRTSNSLLTVKITDGIECRR